MGLDVAARNGGGPLRPEPTHGAVHELAHELAKDHPRETPAIEHLPDATAHGSRKQRIPGSKTTRPISVYPARESIAPECCRQVHQRSARELRCMIVREGAENPRRHIHDDDVWPRIRDMLDDLARRRALEIGIADASYLQPGEGAADLVAKLVDDLLITPEQEDRGVGALAIA